MSWNVRLWVAVMCVAVTISLPAIAADKDEDEIRALVPRIVQAWESLDPAKVDPYYATDANLTFFDLAPMKYANWAEYRVGVKKMFFDPNRSIKFKLNEDMGVHHQGNLAWVTFTWGADIVPKQGAASKLAGRWTMILERRNGRWLVVHEHVSPPIG